MAKIEECLHCGSRYTTALKGGLCKNCKTSEQRAAMDKENKKIFKAAGRDFICNFCENEKRKLAKKR